MLIYIHRGKWNTEGRSYCHSREFQIYSQAKRVDIQYVYIYIFPNFNLIAQNGIAAAGAIQISENLQYLPNLTSINLNGNGIRKEGGIAIANSLKNIPNLEELKIGQNYYI